MTHHVNMAKALKNKMNNYFKYLKKIILLTVTMALIAGLPNSVLAEPLKLVSLKPNITQVLTQLGLGQQIVGLTKYCKKTKLQQAKIIADYNSIDVESVARLKPNLVIASRENAQERQIQQLVALGIAVKVFDFSTYAGLQTSLAEIAKLTGTEERLAALQTIQTQTWADIKKIMTDKKLTGKAVVILVQREPLMIASGNTFISTLLTEAGFRNIFAENRISYPQINQEEMARESIDFVFDLSYDTVDEPVAGRKPIRLPIDDFLAEPGSVVALKNVLEKLFVIPAKARI
jgi:ABC-type Fe3+-hydroxamate transport system substrate-binding protein